MSRANTPAAGDRPTSAAVLAPASFPSRRSRAPASPLRPARGFPGTSWPRATAAPRRRFACAAQAHCFAPFASNSVTLGRGGGDDRLGCLDPPLVVTRAHVARDGAADCETVAIIVAVRFQRGRKLVGVGGFEPATPSSRTRGATANPAFSCNPTTSRPLSTRARVLVVDQATRPFPSLFHRSAYCTAAKVP
jgi:hypothetical protein